MKHMSVSSLFKPIGTLLAKFHLTVFIVLISAGLALAVIVLNDILTTASLGDGYTSPDTTGTIDQASLDRIKELHTSDEGATPLVLPEGRINPFAE